LAAFSVLMLVVAAMMSVRGCAQLRPVAAGEAEAGSTAGPVLQLRATLVCDCPRALKVVVTASAVGLLTGFFDVGGGFVVVPALVLALGFTMPVAVGTSLLVVAINSSTALLSRIGNGVHLDWLLIGHLPFVGPGQIEHERSQGPSGSVVSDPDGPAEAMGQRSGLVDPEVEVSARPRQADVVAVLQPGAGSVTRADLWACAACCLSIGSEARGSHEDGGD
jgi:Sulfite exporter TauE/SafE